MTGHRDYFLKHQDYLKSQVGNPDGADKPNKSSFDLVSAYYPYHVLTTTCPSTEYADPRVWVREGEKTMKARCQEALSDLRTNNTI
jgi:fructose-bisphosphate aldolase class II